MKDKGRLLPALVTIQKELKKRGLDFEVRSINSLGHVKFPHIYVLYSNGPWYDFKTHSVRIYDSHDHENREHYQPRKTGEYNYDRMTTYIKRLLKSAAARKKLDDERDRIRKVNEKIFSKVIKRSKKLRDSYAREIVFRLHSSGSQENCAIVQVGDGFFNVNSDQAAKLLDLLLEFQE